LSQRKMIGVTRRDRILSVRERTNVTESVIEEIQRRRLSWFGSLLSCYWRKKQRIQAKMWMENIKEDFELRNVQFKDAIAKDGTAWRQRTSSTSSSL